MLDSHDRPADFRALQALVSACRACQQAGYLQRANPIPLGGRPSDRIMVIGQAPGPVTDRRGYHFAGPAGHVLQQWLDRAGFPPGFFRSGCYLTSLTRCFPGKAASGGDRRPSPAELRLCRPHLDRELELVNPALVLLVGQMAIEAFLGRQPLDQVVGRVFQRDGRYLLPLPHSSGVSRWLNAPEHRALLDRALEHLARLREALLLADSPPPVR